MIYIAIVLIGLFGLLSALSTLLLCVSFTKAQRGKYPILAKFDGKQLHLFFATAIFFLIAYGANMYKDVLIVKSSLEFTAGPDKELSQKATSAAIKRELQGAAAELVSKAEDYFNAAQHDFAARRY